MKVLVVGASGALGLPTVRALVAAGHDVIGTTRVSAKLGSIEQAGARPVVMDALDRATVGNIVRDLAPEAIISLLTALPKRGPMRPSDFRRHARVTREGTANVVSSARDAGVRRIVAESIQFVYGYGNVGSVTEMSPLPGQAPRSARVGIEGMLAVERAMTDPSIQGIALRYGILYGPGVGHVDYMARMLRRRLLPMPGRPQGAVSWIHVEDAATATVAALERGARGAVYNVADDDPVSIGEFIEELAGAIGARPPRKAPLWLARFVTPYAALVATTTLKVSSERARGELGWTPRYASVKEALKMMRSPAG